jgi:hypothetical protein
LDLASRTKARWPSWPGGPVLWPRCATLRHQVIFG